MEGRTIVRGGKGGGGKKNPFMSQKIKNRVGKCRGGEKKGIFQKKGGEKNFSEEGVCSLNKNKDRERYPCEK